jgi:hypothetical protein
MCRFSDDTCPHCRYLDPTPLWKSGNHRSGIFDFRGTVSQDLPSPEPRYAMPPVNTSHSHRGTHRNSGFRESSMIPLTPKVSKCRIPTLRDLPTCVSLNRRSRTYRSIALRDIATPAPKLGTPTREIPICDVAYDLTAPVTSYQWLHFLLDFKPLSVHALNSLQLCKT